MANQAIIGIATNNKSSNMIHFKFSPRKHTIWFAKLVICVVMLSVFTNARANDWVFDVEVILFKRDVSLSQLQEKFDTPFRLIDHAEHIDLFTPAIRRKHLGDLADQLTECDSFDSESSVDGNTDANNLRDSGSNDFSSTTISSDAQVGFADTDLSTEDPCLLLEQPDPLAWLVDPDTGKQIQRLPKIMVGRDKKEDMIEEPLEFDQQITENLTEDTLNFPMLIPANNLELKEIYNGLRWQKGVTPQLHTVWRQPVIFGKNKAIRLYAGKNFTELFDTTGHAFTAANQSSSQLGSTNFTIMMPDLFTRIERAINSPETLPVWPQDDDIKEVNLLHSDPLWELDGSFKVYLQRIGSVPYLHIDANFDLRVPFSNTEGRKTTHTLAVVPFSQLKRIVSQQLHYFDHPMMGMIIELRRYQPED
jgi:hypothetical protein